MGVLSFVAIDIETTGLDPTTDQIIELAAVRFEDGRETGRISQLVSPECPLPLRIQHLTGITPNMLAGKPTMATVVPSLKAFLGDLPLVAHNAGFDLAFLQMAFGQHGLSLTNRVYDTAELSRITLPRAKNHRLGTLAEILAIKTEQCHRAEDDAEACGRVFLSLLTYIQQMDLGLLRFIAALGEPVNWSLAPLFRAELDVREAAGHKASRLMEWIKPYPGQLHQPEEDAPEGEPHPIDPDLVLTLLGPGGVVAESFSSYEHRPQQLEMAHAVAEALNAGSHLLMEAGTGTGKSLAYLLPAVAWALRNGERVAVATHTINLQEQLWEKDLPFLQEALRDTPLEGFTAALVKGRGNYVCLRKWQESAAEADLLTGMEARSFAIRLASWLAETETGDKSELNLSPIDERRWTDVMSETDTCLGPKCRWFRSHCFAYRARRRARDADVLVLNHAVLFADIASGNVVLPSYRHLILDEAHHVEDVATQNLGISLEKWDVTRTLNHLYRGPGQGFLPLLRRRIPQEQPMPAVEKLIDLTLSARTAADELFTLCASMVQRWSTDDEESRTLRLTDGIRTDSGWDAVDTARSNASFRLRNLGQRLAELGEVLENMDPGPKNVESLLLDIQKQSSLLVQSARAMDLVLLDPQEGDVTWIEVGPRRENQRVGLRSAPINVGEILRETVFNRLRSVIMTSATLSVSGKFDHLKLRLGLADQPADRLGTGELSSPFRYPQQALLCVTEDMPTPHSDREFTQGVQDFLREYLILSGGRTLVLFTSHRQLRQVYQGLKDELEAAGLLLLGQGLDGSRSRLVEEFRTAANGVLFGSASFWEGVDIPGDGLTSVVLVKLPFAPPGEPVTEARMEDLERRGLSSFMHLSLPQAVIKFKQGFGRLVRSKYDRGVVLVLDSRLSPRRTRYGSQFLRSLPGPTTYTGPRSRVIQRALAWLRHGSEADGPDVRSP